MKFSKLTWALMALLSLAVIAATTSTVITQTKDLKINNATDTVALTIQKGSLTSNAVEILSGSTLKFAVPASGVLPIAYGGTAGATAAAARSALGISEASTNGIAATNGTATGLTLVGSITNAGLTASLPVFTDADKVLASKSVANTLLALGIQSGTNHIETSTAAVSFGAAFSTPPNVVATGDNTNIVFATEITVSGFTLNTGPDATNNVNWIAIGAP